MRSLRAAVAAGLAVFCAGCATAPAAKQDEEALLRVDREWAAAASEGKDVERIVSFWSDDATVFPPGAPVVQGKAAIRAFVQQSLAVPGFHVSWTSDRASLSADGTLGYTFATSGTPARSFRPRART